ncbi:MAG: manganese efflux pump [Porphyrobacter sp.]|nr:manganese efflux pump [Porphyrobacter sp.]
MLELLFLAVGLAMDACAVALVRGAVAGARPGGALATAAAFGIAQGAMPLVGWGLGRAFASRIEQIDHWVAFVLLSALGIRMILAARAAPEGAVPQPGRGSRAATLLLAAIATSIDAAVAGIALDAFAAPVAVACLLIGGVTAVLSFAAYLLGGRVPTRAGNAAEAVGGLVLIGLGSKILIEHLTG